jgi:2'-5' RNA ligase
VTEPDGARPIRAFVALDIDAAMRGRVEDAVATLAPQLPGVRWASGGVHVTLRFLGPSAPDVLARLEPALHAAAVRCPAFEARLGPLGMFPDRGSPRTLWLGVSLTPDALALRTACEAAAVACGFEPEPRDFRAHVTLGRWRERTRRPQLPVLDLGPTRIEHLVLFRSDLRPTGAVYTPLATFALAPFPSERASD